MKIYKYFSSDVMGLVFAREGYCGVKCSLPKDYNDPYELFLGVDLDVPTEDLAFYRDIVQQLPQFPTTCFSKSPLVAPMWAHYAENHSGFVLEFEVDALKESFEEIEIRDVEYRSEPNPALAQALERAAVTKKPRHSVWLRQAVLTEAYFSKFLDWSYEQECRLVDRNQYVEDVSGNSILFVPSDCLSAVIVGSGFPQNLKDQSVEIAHEHDMDWYQLQIGKSTPAPFLKNSHEETFVFTEGAITSAHGVCENCMEPLPSSGEYCAWCSITEGDAHAAAGSNPFRILDRIGGLEDYMAMVRDIERRR